jgi:uncharacterized membrane protein
MNIMHIILGLTVGIIIGAVDFSLAKSISALVRPGNARAAQAIMIGGFLFRISAIGFLLWTLSSAGNISFVAVCVGLTGTFTVLTLAYSVKAFLGSAQIQRRISNRR